MVEDDPRAALEALIRERGEDCASLSRLLGRNPAYVQQYIRRGSPRRLGETDRATLAAYFGVPESRLGAAPARAPSAALRPVPRLDVRASAGPGATAADGRTTAALGFSDAWLAQLRPAAGAGGLSLIEVAGTSMLPTLAPGDEILVDTADAGDRLRAGIYVVRFGDALHVKRIVPEGDSFAIRSDNPAADPVAIDDPAAVAIVGRVRWTGRRLD